MNLTSDQTMALLALLSIALIVFLLLEGRRADRAKAEAEDLRHQLMVEKGRIAAESIAYQRLANLVERHSDELAILRRAAGQLPPPRRAKELGPARARQALPEFATMTSEVVGVIELAPTPRTLRERIEANDPALRWDAEHPIIALAAVAS